MSFTQSVRSQPLPNFQNLHLAKDFYLDDVNHMCVTRGRNRVLSEQPDYTGRQCDCKIIQVVPVDACDLYLQVGRIRQTRQCGHRVNGVTGCTVFPKMDLYLEK